jgi:hypothetical protein
LQKELSGVWKGEELVKHAEATTFNACRNEDLEDQQKNNFKLF